MMTTYILIPRVKEEIVPQETHRVKGRLWEDLEDEIHVLLYFSILEKVSLTKLMESSLLTYLLCDLQYVT